MRVVDGEAPSTIDDIGEPIQLRSSRERADCATVNGTGALLMKASGSAGYYASQIVRMVAKPASVRQSRVG